MKRKFLEDLGLEKDIVDQIMQENGNDINKAKSDYEDVKAQLETANNTIKERDKQLKTLKDSAGDNEELKAQITNLQNSNKENAKKYAEDLKELRLNSAIKLAIHDKVFNEDMAAGLFDKTKLVLADDGKVIGIDEQLEGIKKDNAFLFKTGEIKNNYNPSAGAGANANNPFAKETFNLTEQGKLFKENPEQARVLASEAGYKL